MNAPDLIEVTLLGMVTLVRSEHSSNAADLIEVTLSEIEYLVSPAGANEINSPFRIKHLLSSDAYLP